MKLFNIKNILLFALTNVIVSGCSTSAQMSIPQNNQIHSTNYGKDPIILGWLNTLNNNEINSSKLALSKSHNPMVVNYAHKMINAHRDNLNKTMLVANSLDETPIYSSKTMNMKAKGLHEINILKAHSGHTFDVMYMDYMIKDHSMALHKLDKKIHKARAAELKNLLISTRAHVLDHLQQARAIHNSL